MPNPPHKPGLAVVIGVGKPKSSSPPPSWDDDGDEQAGASQPGQDPSQAGGQKVDPQSAGVYTSDQKCVACKWYIHEGHMCQKVEGNDFGLGTVGCTEYFTPEDQGENEPDGDEAGLGAPGGMSGAAPQGQQYGGSNTSQSGQ